MPSNIDASKPVDAQSVNKADIRANFAAAKAELNAGAFITAQHITGAVEMTGNEAYSHTIYVMAYGAAGDGSSNDQPYVQQAITDAFNRNNGSAIPPVSSCPNNQNVVVDLGGRNYRIDSSVAIPNGGMVRIANGTLTAGPSFPLNDPLIIFPTAKIRTHSLYFDNLQFDCADRANGMRITGQSYRITVSECHFMRFTEYGAKTEDSTGDTPPPTVETTFINNWFEQHLEGDTTPPTAYGLWLQGTTDVEVHFNTAVRCNRGYFIDAFAGGMTYIGNQAHDCIVGSFVSENIGSVTFNACMYHNCGAYQYRQYGWNTVRYLACTFILDDGDNSIPIETWLQGTNLELRDFIVRGCIFHAEGTPRNYQAIQFVNGSFDPNLMNGCVVNENTFTGIDPVTTVIANTQAFTSTGAGDTDTLVFGDELLGEPNWFQLNSDSSDGVVVTGSRSAKTLTVRYSKAGSGTLMYRVDSGRQPG